MFPLRFHHWRRLFGTYKWDSFKEVPLSKQDY